MLSLEERVAENVWVRGHGYIFICREGFPELVKERSIVNAYGWGNSSTEAGPILVNESVGL